jgi:ABC-2 type transport system ATP-binding protein
VEALCERVGILVQGELRREGRVSDLLRLDEGGYEIEVRDLPPSLGQTWRNESWIRESGDRWILTVPDHLALEERLKQILRAGATILAVKPVQRSLEDVFLDQVEDRPARPAATITPIHREEAA